LILYELCLSALLGYVICKKIYPKLPRDLRNHELLQATAQSLLNHYEALKERCHYVAYAATSFYLLSLYSFLTKPKPTLPMQQLHLHAISAMILFEIMSLLTVLGYVICKKIYPNLPQDLRKHELLQATAQRVPKIYETLKEPYCHGFYTAIGVYVVFVCHQDQSLPTLPMQQSHLHVIFAMISIEIMSFSLLCYVLYRKIYLKLPRPSNIRKTFLSYMPTEKPKYPQVPSSYYIEEAPKKESPLVFPHHKNIVYDPANDQLQVYHKGRIRIYRRRRNSQQFVYSQGKSENTFPQQSMIAIGDWQGSYFILYATLERTNYPQYYDSLPSPEALNVQDDQQKCYKTVLCTTDQPPTCPMNSAPCHKRKAHGPLSVRPRTIPCPMQQ